MFTSKSFSIVALGLVALAFAAQALAINPQPEPPKQKPILNSAPTQKMSPRVRTTTQKRNVRRSEIRATQTNRATTR